MQAILARLAMKRAALALLAVALVVASGALLRRCAGRRPHAVAAHDLGRAPARFDVAGRVVDRMGRPLRPARFVPGAGAGRP